MLSISVTIIIISVIISLAALNSEKVMFDLAFWPARMRQKGGEWYRFLTHGFIHGSLVHLAFNMYTLYSFGPFLEQYTSQPEIFGRQAKLIFLILYVTSILASTIPDYFKHKDNPGYRSVGASGAVSAIIFANILLYPQLKLIFFIIPIPIPGYIFGALFLLVSAYLEKRGGSNIAHGAHIYGALYGLLYTIVATKLFSEFDAVSNFIDAIRR